MKVNFYLNPYLYLDAQKCTPQHPHNVPKLVDNKKDETLMNFEITNVPKTWFLCGLHPVGSFSHTFKNLVEQGSFTKITRVFSYTLIQHHNNNNVYCHKYLLHQGYSHILTQGNNSR
jgi:hypothetical protein